jgi:selenocysteine-specific translation elongation factor
MHYVISVPINENVASFIGKKGSEESLIFYNRKIDNDVIVVLYPSNDETKQHYAIAESMLLSSQIVISTASIDKLFGEIIVAASLLTRRVVVLDENDVSKILANGILKNYTLSTKEELLSKIIASKVPEGGEINRVDVDHAFPVKGIGTVALGIVTSGKVKVHDTLYSTSGKQVSIKSIQAQDVDIAEAGIGTRVGLAIKGAEPEDIDKGDLLLSKQTSRSKSANTSIKTSALANEKIEVGSRYTFVSNFTHVLAKVEQYDGKNATLSFEKPISILKGDQFLLIREANPRIFASGVIEEAKA